ncbi:MAG: YggT family protein [Gemmatimonadota bacterium]
MTDALGALVALSGLVRTVLLAGGIVVAAIATADWAARTRRISPFGGLSRFMRVQVDPRLAGVERQVVRAGGHPSATPWWGLVVYVVVAGLVIAGVDALAGLVREVTLFSTAGVVGILALLVHWVFRFLALALLVRVLSSWFPRLAYSVWTRWSFRATEWMLAPLRRVLPTFGMIDLSPLVAWFALQPVEWLVMHLFFPGF